MKAGLWFLGWAGRPPGRRAQTRWWWGGTAELRPDPERAEGWSLLIDGAPQSHVDLADPSHLAFPYQRRLGHVIDLVAPAGQPLRVLHLGGGALTLARYVGATRPRSTQQVVEKDAALVRLVRRVLPLGPQARVKVREGDAREGLGRVADGWADLVVADVFSGARTPAHLTSVEFLAEVRRVLAPGGWYAGNLADGPPLAYLRGQVATAAVVFPEVAVAADPVVWRGKRFGNAVLVAAGQPLPLLFSPSSASAPLHFFSPSLFLPFSSLLLFSLSLSSFFPPSPPSLSPLSPFS
ncbi:spermidine synthase, partial [Streptomyces albidoflavus]|uniref:spermidine synthase n=1 Tax=Streptomyces albidoflavus TaxID=1886 RepID=UPI00211CE786